jgi:hypothetical protein
MLGDTQQLIPIEGSDHDFSKTSNYFIMWGRRGKEDCEVKRRPKTMVHLWKQRATRRKMILIAWRWVCKFQKLLPNGFGTLLAQDKGK